MCLHGVCSSILTLIYQAKILYLVVFLIGFRPALPEGGEKKEKEVREIQ